MSGRPEEPGVADTSDPASSAARIPTTGRFGQHARRLYEYIKTPFGVAWCCVLVLLGSATAVHLAANAQAAYNFEAGSGSIGEYEYLPFPTTELDTALVREAIQTRQFTETTNTTTQSEALKRVFDQNPSLSPFRSNSSLSNLWSIGVIVGILGREGAVIRAIAPPRSASAHILDLASACSGVTQNADQDSESDACQNASESLAGYLSFVEMRIDPKIRAFVEEHRFVLASGYARVAREGLEHFYVPPGLVDEGTQKEINLIYLESAIFTQPLENYRYPNVTWDCLVGLEAAYSDFTLDTGSNPSPDDNSRLARCKAQGDTAKFVMPIREALRFSSARPEEPLPADSSSSDAVHRDLIQLLTARAKFWRAWNCRSHEPTPAQNCDELAADFRAYATTQLDRHWTIDNFRRDLTYYLVESEKWQ